MAGINWQSPTKAYEFPQQYVPVVQESWEADYPYRVAVCRETYQGQIVYRTIKCATLEIAQAISAATTMEQPPFLADSQHGTNLTIQQAYAIAREAFDVQGNYEDAVALIEDSIPRSGLRVVVLRKLQEIAENA